LPEVIGVGGTTLHLNNNGSRANEFVWNSDGADDAFGSLYAAAFGVTAGATGGGCSLEYPPTTWQSHVAGYSATGCGGMRSATDISADGDPDSGLDVYDSYDPFVGQTDDPGAMGWGTEAGTSLSAAIIAAMWGLAGGAHGVKYPSLTLYGHTGSSAILDVTRGGNGFCGGDDPVDCQDSIGNVNPNQFAVIGDDTAAAGLTDCAWDSLGAQVSADTQCNATTGYDGASGIGAPKGLGAFAAAALKAAISGATTVTVKKSHQYTDVVTDPYPGGTSPITYKWTFSDGGRGTGRTLSHAFTKAGHATVTVVATDAYGHTVSASKTVTVKKKAKKPKKNKKK
jgi:hypothetical protein